MTSSFEGRPQSDPWTPRILADAIARVGIPGAIALFVVYLGATQLPKLVISVETAISEVRANQELMREILRQTEKQSWIIRMTCWNAANAAKDESGKRKCYE